MAGITLAQAEAQLAAWLAASTAVASNQSYTIAGRTYTRADAGRYFAAYRHALQKLAGWGRSYRAETRR